MLEGALVQDRYKVLSLLGKGGAAAVYSVEDASTGKKLALKQLLLPPDGRRTEQHELRFRREFHTMAGLVHPNIVEVYDYGVAGKEGPFYTMELLSGQDLRALGRCAVDVACSLLRDVASALALLHARHLVHRDVGPRNVRRSHDGAAKLLDFGVLATSGVAGDVAGTPPCMPPETVRLLPVDHKADLYGLGALAYWLLTGRHAYPAKTVFELERLWAERPPRPSDLRPDIPPALNDLILSLLSLDPLGRPTRAAEVIDRLVAIAGLDPTTDAENEVGQGYLMSAALVGRQHELAKIKDHVEKAARGQGSVLLFEAPLGEGKSRLLRECSLQAQLAGMDVLYASNDATGRGPYGLLRELTRTLIARMPNEVFRIAAPRASILGRVLPEVLPGSGAAVPLDPLDGDPRQDRMRLQAALTAFFTDVIARRKVAILIDDVQHADEGSAAVLAQLAHGARGRSLLVALTLGSDEPIHAQAAVASVQEVAERLRLRALAIADVEQLTAALFGDAPHARLVRWMHEVTGGSPLRVLGLARHLVDRGTIKYEYGLWTIPDDLDATELPPGLAGVMDRKVAGLRPQARALAEALAVHGGELPLGVCVALDESHSERATFAALDELVFEEVLLGSGDRFRFRHEGLREALLRGLDEARRRSLHLRVGHLLVSRGEAGEDREAEVGWHFYRGGERSRAAPLLARAGERQHAAQSFRDAVPPLEAALAVYEAEGAPPTACLDLRRMLVIAGVMFDRAVLLRYAEPTFRTLRHHGGVDVSERAARYLGKKLGVLFGLLYARIRHTLTPAARRGPPPVLALTTLAILVTATASAYSLAFDLEGFRRHLRHIELFTAFPRRLPYASYLLCHSLLAIPLGRWRTVRENVARALAIMASHPAHDPFYRRNGIAAAHYMLASALATDQDPSFEREVEEVKKQDLRFFDVSAEMSRLFYHRLRGEEDVAREIEAKVELAFVQLGSMWIFQSQLPWVSSFAYAINRDVLGLKRCIEKLDRLCKAGYGFEAFLDLARGEYYRERGQLDAAHTALTRAIAALPEEELFRRQRVLAALAEVLLAQGRSAEAQQVAEEAFALSADREVIHVTWRIRCGRVVALALAANGEPARAAQRLDELLADVAFLKSPTMSGSLHEARARLALLSGDRAAYEEHLAEAERWFRATRNPALVARCERLAEAGALGQSGGDAALGDESVTRRDITDDVAAAMASCTSAEARVARALDFLLDATSGAEGHLYLAQDGALRLAVSSSSAEPPPTWIALLQRAAATLDEEGATVVQPPARARGAESAVWMPVVLTVREGKNANDGDGTARPKRTLIAAAAIVQGAIPLEPPDEATLEALARELRRTDDPGTVSIGSMTF